MGSGGWKATDWDAYAAKTAHKSREDIFKSRSIDAYLDPKNVRVRESRDSSDNPESNAIITALDVTGSMGYIAEQMAKEGLGTFFKEMFKRKPVTDPHLMFMAVGDVYCDSAPLQVSQFEADNRIVDQLSKIYLEGGGGGNNTESYDFPWYFAGRHTSIDCWEKRHKKGYLFTIGDEEAPAGLTKKGIKRFLNEDVQSNISSEQALRMASKMYNVYHITAAEGNHCRYGNLNTVKASWQAILGQHAVVLEDSTKLSELLISLIQVNEGVSKKAVMTSWDGSTSLIISKAMSEIAENGAIIQNGVVTL